MQFLERDIVKGYLADGTLRLVHSTAEDAVFFSLAENGGLLADWRLSHLETLRKLAVYERFSTLDRAHWKACHSCGVLVSMRPLGATWVRRYTSLPGRAGVYCRDCVASHAPLRDSYRRLLAGSTFLDMLQLAWQEDGYQLHPRRFRFSWYGPHSNPPNTVVRELRARGARDFILGLAAHDVRSTDFMVWLPAASRLDVHSINAIG